MKTFNNFLQKRFMSVSRTLIIYYLILFLLFLLMIFVTEKKNIDESLKSIIESHLLLFEKHSYVDSKTQDLPITLYLQKKDGLFYNPQTNTVITSPKNTESERINDFRQKSNPDKNGNILIVFVDQFSFYSYYLAQTYIYVPLFFMMYLIFLLLFYDLHTYWTIRYEALSDFLTEIYNRNFTKLVQPLMWDYFKDLISSLNQFAISVNERYISFIGWTQEVKDLNFSSQMTQMAKQIETKINQKYQFKGEKIHLSFIKMPTNPLYFIFFLSTFSESFFLPFFNYYFVQNIKSSLLDYLMILLTIYIGFFLYSVLQKGQNKPTLLITLCLFFSILGKIGLGYEMITDLEVIILYLLSVAFQFFALVLYLFFHFRPWNLRKICLYICAGILSGFITGWILQTNEIAVHALLFSVFCTSLTVSYFFSSTQEKSP